MSYGEGYYSVKVPSQAVEKMIEVLGIPDYDVDAYPREDGTVDMDFRGSDFALSLLEEYGKEPNPFPFVAYLMDSEEGNHYAMVGIESGHFIKVECSRVGGNPIVEMLPNGTWDGNQLRNAHEYWAMFHTALRQMHAADSAAV